MPAVTDKTPALSDDAAERRQRLREAMNLQAIEGNPLDADDIAMFEMFEREGWTHEQRLAFILKAARASADT